jgi:shikimate 5-dehydrogenase
VNHWINKDTEIYCSFAKTAGNTGCQMMNTSFYYYGLNKIYKSFSISNIEDAVNAVKALNIKGFAITMPYKTQVLSFVDKCDDDVKQIGAANTVLNDNGILTAYNTDYLAARTFLDKSLGLDLYILGNGGYSKAVQQAAKSLGYDYTLVTKENWDIISSIGANVIVYNCTPVENIKVNTSQFIDCIVTTKTGRELASIQASHQFKLYTGLEFPL